MDIAADYYHSSFGIQSVMERIKLYLNHRNDETEDHTIILDTILLYRGNIYATITLDMDTRLATQWQLFGLHWPANSR